MWILYHLITFAISTRKLSFVKWAFWIKFPNPDPSKLVCYKVCENQLKTTTKGRKSTFAKHSSKENHQNTPGTMFLVKLLRKKNRLLKLIVQLNFITNSNINFYTL